MTVEPAYQVSGIIVPLLCFAEFGVSVRKLTQFDVHVTVLSINLNFEQM